MNNNHAANMTEFIEKTMLIFEKQVEENKTLKEEAETIFQMGKVMQLESKEFLKLNKERTGTRVSNKTGALRNSIIKKAIIFLREK